MSAARPAVLITGAARRIGRALALDLAGHGWDVAIHYHGAADEAEAVAREIKALGARAVLLGAELADADAASGLVPAAVKALGRPLDAVINNASMFEKDDVRSLTADSFDRHQAVNLRAPLLIAQAFARTLPAHHTGAVINIIDQRVLKLNPQYMSYMVSKSGLWTLTRTLAQALAPRIRVNGIGPGPTLKNTRQSDADFAEEQARTLLRRGPDLAEICGAVRFLLETPSVTGQMIALDGGQHLNWRTDDILED
ncbi:MAG: SDR family oxidoreductase [Alphaproteobacteria bacterium]|nr:MAG: SDR family oxidoreductase [Alphaproteobacteria bacterium]